MALKSFPTRIDGERVEIKVGDRISPEVARAWPIPNRMAMQSQRFVRYFETAKEADQMAQALSAQAQNNPERAMMAAEAAAEKRPTRAPHLTAEAIAKAQKKRLATLARKKAEAAAAELTAPPADAVEQPVEQPVA